MSRRKIDETGNVYGRLTVLYQTPNSGGAGKKIKWHCQCECGKEKDIDGGSLRNGSTKSCGCIQKEIVSHFNEKDLVGQHFEKLLVLEKTDKRKNGKIVWKCQCDCGEICYKTTSNLTLQQSKCCGKCLQIKSWGEQKIINILKENNISFEREKIFSNCFYTIPNSKCRFDFYVNNEYLIEYDGKQHFIKDSGYGKDLENIQARDNFKNQWCKDNNIPLIRIPYTHYDNLCIEDLLLETSKFVT